MRSALALAATLVVAGALTFVIASGLEDVTHPASGGPAGERVAELVMTARAADRFGIFYPTVAAGWHRPALARPIVSRPPGLDLGARAAFAATSALVAARGGTVASREPPSAVRALALAAAALAVLAFARLAWIGWGPAAGAAGAALFALSPYLGAYATVPHGGMPALAAALMALGSVLRFRRTRGRTSAAAAVAWLLIAGLFDWSAYLLIVPLGAMALASRALAGRVTRVRPQALGLPDGLAGPLASVVRRREQNTAIALGKALAIATLIELVAFLVWAFLAGGLGDFGAALARGGPALLPGGPGAPGALSPAVLGPAGLVVIGLWALAALARFATGQAEARSAPVAALLGAGVLFPFMLPGLARASLHLPALAAGGAALAAIDLAAVAVAIAAQRKLVLGETAPDAAPVALGVLLALMAAATVPTWRHARAEGQAAARAPTAGASTLALARELATTTEPTDRLLVLPGFPLPLSFLAAVDRDLEAAPALAALETQARSGPPGVALLAEPLPADAAVALAPLLGRHPALRIGSSWLVDLRRHEPGILSYEATGPGGARARRPRDEIALDVAYGVLPSADRLPEIDDAEALPRAELVAYHNLRGGLGPDDPERARARAALLAGFALAPRWFDPAPGGTPIGVRLASRARRLDVIWECPERPVVLPEDVTVGGVRVALRPADRTARPLQLDRPFSPPCPAGALPGDLHEQSFALELPARGRFHVAMHLYRDGKPRLPLTPAPVELGIVDCNDSD